MSFRSRLREVTNYNLKTLRDAPLSEISGALGDLGTLLPLMIAMAVNGSIDLSSTLVFSGLTNVLAGAFYGVPLPVQPMKAIASITISQKFSKEETAAAGLTMGIAVFLLSATGLLKWLNKVVPVPVVKGIQVGAGLSLVNNAVANLFIPLQWTEPWWDNKIWALAAIAGVITTDLYPKLPYALIVFAFGLVIAATTGSAFPRDLESSSAGLWTPSPFVPSPHAWRVGAVDAAIPQLPLTTLNSILAVTSLSASLFPTFPPPPSTTSLGFSISIANLVACWFGGMPVCFGSGGFAAQYRFGARSGASVILLGLVKLTLGLFVGNAVMPLLQRLPKSLLGVMVIAAGVQLSMVGHDVSDTADLWEQAAEDAEGEQPARLTKESRERERKNRWRVMLVTAAGCLAFKNDAVGFLAGLVWHWSLRIPSWIERMRHRSTRIRLDVQG